MIFIVDSVVKFYVAAMLVTNFWPHTVVLISGQTVHQCQCSQGQVVSFTQP